MQKNPIWLVGVFPNENLIILKVDRKKDPLRALYMEIVLLLMRANNLYLYLYHLSYSSSIFDYAQFR